MEDRRRRKNAWRDAAHGIPDELLEIVFLRLPSPLDLVRAACTCKRWRHIVADSRFLRRFRSLHASAHVVGHYRVDEGQYAPRPPGRNPVFFPSTPSRSADTVDARHFSLDFLPRPDSGGGRWELADSRGGLLLLLNEDNGDLPSLAVCEPLTRRYRVLPPSAWFHGCSCFGAFLLDGDADETGGCIGLSNFRVVCALYRHGIARACAFSSDGSYWTAARSTAVCADEYWLAKTLGHVHFAGSTGGSVYWTTGVGLLDVLVLDKDTAKFSSDGLPEDMDMEHHELRDKYHEYTYQLPWPPTIRACLPL